MSQFIEDLNISIDVNPERWNKAIKRVAAQIASMGVSGQIAAQNTQRLMSVLQTKNVSDGLWKTTELPLNPINAEGLTIWAQNRSVVPINVRQFGSSQKAILDRIEKLSVKPESAECANLRTMEPDESAPTGRRKISLYEDE